MEYNKQDTINLLKDEPQKTIQRIVGNYFGEVANHYTCRRIEEDITNETGLECEVFIDDVGVVSVKVYMDSDCCLNLKIWS